MPTHTDIPADRGKHHMGGQVYAVVSDHGVRFTLRYSLAGKKRECGLGAGIGIEEARRRADHIKHEIWAGRDPVAEKKARKAKTAEPKTITLWKAVEEKFEVERPSWKRIETGDDWIRSLEMYVKPALGDRTVDGVTPSDVAKCLKPIWRTKPARAERVLARLGSVFEWCVAHEFRTAANPATMVLMRNLLGPLAKDEEHLAALDWRQVPKFLAEVRKRSSAGNRALEFAILTTSRASPVRFATWDEIDMVSKVWTIPGDKMKMTVEHTVPLSEAAIALLEEVPVDQREGLLFPSRGGMPLSAWGMNKICDYVTARIGLARTTQHGISRASFRSWVQDTRHSEGPLAERQLAHKLDKIQSAYARAQATEQRRPMIEAWGDYCEQA